jgi:hypothetical protein
VSRPEPWRCPDCLTWIAPHVTEHRCDPPAAMVSVTSIDPPGSGSGFAATAVPSGTTITYNVTGSAVRPEDVLRAMQAGVNRD